MALSTLGYFIAEGALLPTVPLYVTGPLRGGDVAVGLVVGAFSASALVLRPWVGRLTDRRGRRFVMLVGATVFGVSVAGYLVAPSVPVMILMRLLTGAGAAFFFVGAATAISDLAPDERRGEAVSFFSLALYTGIAIGPVMGEAAIRGSDFSLAWLVTLAAAGFALLLALPVPDTRPEGERGVGRLRLAHPAAVLPGVVILTSIWGMAGFFAYVPLYARELGLGNSRLVFVAFSVVVLLIRSFGAKLPDRLGAGRAARAALSASAAGLVVVGVWRHAAGLFVGTVVLAVGIALAFPALLTLAVARAPASERGAVVGTFTAFVDLAFGLGPVSLGFVADAAGYQATFLAAAGVAAGGLVLLLLRRRRAAR